MLVVTRKLELAVLGEADEKNRGWDFLRKLDREVWHVANQVISDQWFHDSFETKIMQPDQQKLEEVDMQLAELYLQLRGADEKTRKTVEKQALALKKERNKVMSDARIEARNKLRELYGTTRQNQSYRMVSRAHQDWGSGVYDALVGKVNTDFANDYPDVLKGRRPLRRYKKGLPIPFRASSLKFVQDEEGNLFLQWVKGIRFAIVFGRDRSSRRAEISRILSGEYSYGDSSIQVKDKKLYLLLSLKHPKKDIVLNPQVALVVQAGIQIPVKCRLAGDDDPKNTLHVGDATEILHKRIHFQRAYRRLQIHMREALGGHGRTRKMQALTRLKQNERNWIRTYNHVISKRVMDYCVKLNAGTILLHEIKELPKDEEEAKFLARNWAGHELKTMLQQKAKVLNISLEIVDEKL